MTGVRAVWRLVLSLPLLGLLAPACLRLSEPDSFNCVNAADCLADERCSNESICVPKDSCEAQSDCDASETCDSYKCVAGQCYEGHEATCGTFRCRYFSKHCNSACTSENECQDGNSCKDGACVPSPNLANDQPCSQNAECQSRACCGAEGHKACKQSCPGDIGESCGYPDNKACLVGSCFGDSFCSITCSVDSDCRVSPWGTKNLCRKNRLGASVCFPGCANDAQCHDNLDQYFSCTSGACSGDYLSDDDVRLQ